MDHYGMEFLANLNLNKSTATPRDTPILSLLLPDPDTIMRAQLLVYILPDAC